MSEGLSVVLPAFNSVESLRERVPKLRETLARHFSPIELIVVDDASSGDLQSLREMTPRVRLFRNRLNLGKGASTWIGLRAARHAKVLCTDADVPFDMESYDRVSASLRAGAPVTIGNRRRADSQVLLRFDALRYVAQRHLIGIGFNRLVRAITRLPHTDTQCGLKAFDRETALDLFRCVSEAGFLFDIELLIAADERGVPVVDVPVCVRYEDSETSLRWRTDAWQSGLSLLRIAARLWRGAYRDAPEAPALDALRSHSIELSPTGT